MNTVGERAHLSIGEVLNLLQDEFPDVTISKIRFLESQGLLDPERTPSGYRKFYEGDIERLRWILRQQRENFLPLKVIKDRLAAGELDAPEVHAPTRDTSVPLLRADDEQVTKPSVGPSVESAVGSAVAAVPAHHGERSAGERDVGALLDTGQTGMSVPLEELVAITGLSAREVSELERFGLVTGRTAGGGVLYDEDAVLVARLAASFGAHGLEPRHLRMYKVSAEREAGVFEQLVMPLLSQRRPEARQEAVERIEDLAALGDRLRAAMLRQALRAELGHR